MASDEPSSQASGKIGDDVNRREDLSLITGNTEYTDDLVQPGSLYASILRSQHGHAEVVDIDTSAAEDADGVVAVFTWEDVKASGIPGEVPFPPSKIDDPPAKLNTDLTIPRRPILADGVVRYTGEPVAVVVATDRYTAANAAPKVDVTYNTHEAVVDPVEATADDAPRLHEEIPDNVALDWETGNPDATDEAFDEADHTVESDLVNQRLAPNTMEPRTVAADYDSAAKELSVVMSTQVPHRHRNTLAEALDMPENKVSLRSPDVGGGFGAKSKYYPAEVITAWCSTQLGRPVAWQATRSESFVSDIHGRGHDTHAELAFDDDGTIRGLRVKTHVDLGGYLSRVGPGIATDSYANVLSNQYRIPGIHCRTIGVYTNKTPLDAYRGAGRPEAAYVTERLVRLAAAELEMDPAELRRRNLIPTEAFPYRTPMGLEYDSGDYEKAFDKALEMVEYDELRERQRKLRKEGRYLGIGIGNLVETAGDPRRESSLLRFHSDGTITAHLGTHDQGQGHATTFAQVVSSELGIDYGDVEVREGHTDSSPEGKGTFGSRSAIAAGTALVECAGQIVEKARSIAAHQFEAAETDIEFEDGEFRIRGSPDRSIDIQTIAKTAYAGENLPSDAEHGLEAQVFSRADTAIPFGTHVAVVEIDPRSGDIEFERFVAVDDCGVQINPKIVEGQVHGGVAQGIGQALYENVDYESNGTLISSSYTNYAMPRAHLLPDFETGHTVTPSPRNPLGVKGVAESGTVASTVAVINAVVDALEPFGVDHIDMPATPEKVWRAIDESDADPMATVAADAEGDT